MDTPTISKDINIVTDIPVAVEKLLSSYSAALGNDYEKYFNHVCRVVENCRLLDPNSENLDKYIIAGVFHDIGIWTHHTIDYLSPSASVAQQYLALQGELILTREVSLMIEWHHKTTAYKGDFQYTVNVFRKADWIDVSFGWLTFGINDRKLSMLRNRYPNRGFHTFLISRLADNFLKHPLSPLPMFRR